MNELQGKIIKGIGGFYYVYVEARGIYECRAKGIFRKDKIKPLVGDQVVISVISDEEMLGNIDSILERNNTLIRPSVANVDQAMVVFAAAEPKPNFNLLDRFLISMRLQDVPTVICFNKVDMVADDEIVKLAKIYEKSGSKVMFISVLEDDGVEDIKSVLKAKTTVLAGPSGVGKSSLLNRLAPDANMETGEISKKLKRGKHTTRHSEIFYIEPNTYVMDTPGFSSLDVRLLEKEEVKDYFEEFRDYEDECKFLGCLHLKEPDCGVKEAVLRGEISEIRYENYKLLIEEVESKKKY
ncbi:MAG: ribosome small subunit-dependent GTPase A [Lachnospiraceae bacterium]|nr:ribosome small subunit-dependent GTPase A [Lachnospiraceae bacterium]